MRIIHDPLTKLISVTFRRSQGHLMRPVVELYTNLDLAQLSAIVPDDSDQIHLAATKNIERSTRASVANFLRALAVAYFPHHQSLISSMTSLTWSHPWDPTEGNPLYREICWAGTSTRPVVNWSGKGSSWRNGHWEWGNSSGNGHY